MDGFDVVEERIELPSACLSLLRPRDSEELLDEEAFEREEFLPYWADLWPSARALAAHLTRLPLSGMRVLELGCGLGVPSLVAALAGAEVLATDWSADALRFVDLNAARNGAALETRLVRWDDPRALQDETSFDLVVAADVLYEQRNVDQLLGLLPEVTAPGGRVVLMDPDRVPAQRFLREAEAAWTVRIEPTAVERVRLVELRRTV